MKKHPIIAQRYELVRQLGKGATGVTHFALDLKNDSQPVAIKLVPRLRGRPDLQKSFNNECQVLRQLQHPNLVKILNSGQEKDTLYLVSEFIEGSDLVSEAKRRDWNAVFSLMVQAAWALTYLENQHVLHRDIKPQNILVGKIVTPSEADLQDRLRLKLIDFGVAAAEREANTKPAAGTLIYMAPEVIRGEKIDGRADLYSLGVVFYEMALGKLPIHESRDFSLFLKRLVEEEIDLRPLHAGGTPRGVIEVIRHLTFKEPAQRMKAASEIIHLLNQWEQENFPDEPVDLDHGFHRNVFQNLKAPSAESQKPYESNPEKVLAEVQTLSRSGRNTEAWELAALHLNSIADWQTPALVEDFLALVIYLLTEQGRLEEAQQYLTRLKNHPTFAGKSPLEYYVSGTYLYLRQGKRHEAQALLESTPPLLRQDASPAKLARFENYRGLLDQGEKKFLEAAAHFEHAAQFAQQAGRPDQEASFTANAAGLYLEQNRWKRSYQLFQKAIGLAEQIKNPSLIASIQHNLGNLFLYFGRWNEAESALLRSLEWAGSQGLKPLMASNLYLLTVTEDGRGNRERVADYFSQILALAKEWGDTETMLQALLAKGYFELSDQDWKSAAKTAADLQKRAKAGNHDRYLLQAGWLDAKIKIATGQGKDPGVQKTLTEIQAKAELNGTPNVLWQVLSEQGELAKANKDLASARIFFTKAKTVLDALEMEVPEEFRESFYRDRKKEPLLMALKDIPSSSPSPQSPSPNPEPGMDLFNHGGISFDKWTDLNRRLLLQQHVDPLLEEILDAAIQLTGAERGFLILAEAGPLRIRAARNIPMESLEQQEMLFSASVAREVLRQGTPQMIFDAQTDQRFSAAESVTELKLRSLFCVPLKVGDRPVGLVYLDNRFREGVFQKEHLPLMKALADQAALALEHARLNDENLTAIEELKESKKLIEKLNARLEKDLEDTTHHLHAVEEGLRRQNEDLALKYTYDKIIGKSSKMQEILKALDRVVETNMNVYIYGESGTGKELIAQAIHFNSPRKNKPFITENCAALPENLLEAELFGYVRGAFTGAERNRIGLFELAHGGTLFLDEVGDMSTPLQSKLLRVLQEGTLRPLGSNEYRKVDVRVISASNKDLRELVQQKKFRQDLFYRLHVMRLNLPPLRDRREDIPLLIDHFLKLSLGDSGKKLPRLTPEAFKILFNYDWPGNIRELQNEVSRMTALVTGSKIGPDLLSPHLREKLASALGSILNKGLEPQVEELEKRAILEALGIVGGNKVKAAKMLKISRRTLYLKMAAFKMDSRYGKKSPATPRQMAKK